MKEKSAHILSFVFGWGILLVLFCVLCTCVGFLAALVIGGETAAALCAVLSGQVLPRLYTAAVISCFIGIGAMMLRGEKTFVLEKPQEVDLDSLEK